MPFPFRIWPRRRAAQGQPAQAPGHNQGNRQTAAAPLLGYPPATSYGNIQEWADNVQPDANNSGSESPSPGNGDVNGSSNGNVNGNGYAGSQQAPLTSDGDIQQGNGGSNVAQHCNSSGNEAPNNGNNTGNEADKYRFRKRDALRAFLLARLENVLIRARRARDRLARPRGPSPNDRTAPTNEHSRFQLPGEAAAGKPPAPYLMAP